VGWGVIAVNSINYRVSDGTESAQFMQALPTEHRDFVAGFLENPVRILA